ncbi:hypothetical protein BDW02DRAFT_581735 [Decorospora gaudefroyi]|uniref:Uncharacterized protein n=1 Tax=Decorospora gaudefroyi TaxID=184978 RepID=A0A6A5K2C5_9PLEO|nr:hypothetical protein BDW02DRAFT_581735 [Decorospora gaudefroyi]
MSRAKPKDIIYTPQGSRYISPAVQQFVDTMTTVCGTVGLRTGYLRRFITLLRYSKRYTSNDVAVQGGSGLVVSGSGLCYRTCDPWQHLGTREDGLSQLVALVFRRLIRSFAIPIYSVDQCHQQEDQKTRFDTTQSARVPLPRQHTCAPGAAARDSRQQCLDYQGRFCRVVKRVVERVVEVALTCRLESEPEVSMPLASICIVVE